MFSANNTFAIGGYTTEKKNFHKEIPQRIFTYTKNQFKYLILNNKVAIKIVCFFLGRTRRRKIDIFVMIIFDFPFNTNFRQLFFGKNLIWKLIWILIIFLGKHFGWVLKRTAKEGFLEARSEIFFFNRRFLEFKFLKGSFLNFISKAGSSIWSSVSHFTFGLGRTHPKWALEKFH